MAKVFVSTFPFCRTSKVALDILVSNGHEVVVNPLGRKMKPIEVSESARDFDALIAGTEDLTDLVTNSKSLKLISRVGVGLDSVPLGLCKEKGIAVSYTPDAVSPAVSELAVCLIVDAMRKVTYADREIRKGEWSRPYGERIGGATIGILGFGRIGKRVASHLLGYLPKEILVCDLIDQKDSIRLLSDVASNLYQVNRDLGKNWGATTIKQVDLDSLLKMSDAITIHVPLTAQTKNLLNYKKMSLMKSSAVLINTARGGIVNENDLYKVLQENLISAAAMDVFEEEPYKGPLSTLENVILTQHMGSCSNDCREDMESEASENVVGFFNGGRWERVV
ncbi:phosphoglycerate dehydrogenase [Leptospira bandrabouensis]|uniref:phosphoglycerate dehydrogenase n=1 Tax=Leptospira bandrabouensis TaxID=2484903 RepID=UPI001EE96EF9|nr:phosphoglycerate dehydrogenase [Leptospira bandrabouensis]MCG6144975.1 phosphoglycerate dehydrogenase [Leptospira bandrabouensis]MCG6160388.1 phosphoglycerate dehydrogenase [Leptospira bandrabouensis]MCG6164320.1 phosphoglycerate dehydrogenase [Leptospira bandrabouensis]